MYSMLYVCVYDDNVCYVWKHDMYVLFALDSPLCSCLLASEFYHNLAIDRSSTQSSRVGPTSY